MMQLETLVLKTIKQYALIAPGDKVVLGLSGGPDSLCLLHVLKGFEAELGFTLSALHLNHGIREDSDDDAAWLQGHCVGLGVPLTVIRRDVTAIASELGTSVEEAGRIERQKALLSFGADKVALAHNRDDQAETVLMRILRGTGTHGLAAMEYRRADGVIRPLLDVSRAEIEEYCAANGLTPLRDSTNTEPIYTRNKIRLELLPEIETEYNPNIRETLARLAVNAREDDDCLNQIARDWLQKNCEVTSETSRNLPIKGIKYLSSAIEKRVICMAFGQIGLTEDIAAVHLNSLKAAIEKNEGGKVIEFPSGYRAKILHGILTFYRE